jgi:hypothetical protein
MCVKLWLPLQWSEFLATDPEVRVRFPALPDFLRSSGSGTGSTQSREYNWGATWEKSSGSGLESQEHGRRDPSRWPHGSLYPQNLALTSPTTGGPLAGIVRWHAQATEFSLGLVLIWDVHNAYHWRPDSGSAHNCRVVWLFRHALLLVTYHLI